MFLRSNKRIKDGKEHRYYTVVESRRLGSGKIAQRQVLYLGEINDSQQAAWRKTLEVFDEDQQRFTTLSLFAEDRPASADVLNSVPKDFGLNFNLTQLSFGIYGFLLVLVMVLRPQGLLPERRRRLELTEAVGTGETLLEEPS